MLASPVRPIVRLSPASLARFRRVAIGFAFGRFARKLHRLDEPADTFRRPPDPRSRDGFASSDHAPAAASLAPFFPPLTSLGAGF